MTEIKAENSQWKAYLKIKEYACIEKAPNELEAQSKYLKR